MDKKSKISRFIHDYSLSLILIFLFLFSWLGQLLFQWNEFVSNAHQHNQVPQVNEFANEFFSATTENWQSEFLQLFTMVVLTSMFNHKGSPESKDSEEKTEKKLNIISHKVDKLIKFLEVSKK